MGWGRRGLKKIRREKMDGPSNFFRQNYVLGPTNILLGLGVRIRVEAWPMHEYAF